MAMSHSTTTSTRRRPDDVPIVLGLLVVSNLVAVYSPWEPLRVAFGLLLLFVLPGYALLTLFFPRETDAQRPGRSGIDGLERAALSFGLSVSLLPPLYLLAFVLVGWSTPSPAFVFSLLNATIVVLTILGLLRRLRVDPSERYDLPVRGWAGSTTTAVRETDRRTLMANVALGVAGVTAVGSLLYSLSSPPEGEAFTEFYLVTEDETGEYTAGDFPTSLTADEPQAQIVGIENHEGEPTTYTISAELQRVDASTETIRVLEHGDRTEQTVRLDDAETVYVEQTLTPTMVGETLRLQYALDRGEPTDRPYRELHLWVDVAEADTDPAGA